MGGDRLRRLWRGWPAWRACHNPPTRGDKSTTIPDISYYSARALLVQVFSGPTSKSAPPSPSAVNSPEYEWGGGSYNTMDSPGSTPRRVLPSPPIYSPQSGSPRSPPRSLVYPSSPQRSPGWEQAAEEQRQWEQAVEEQRQVQQQVVDRRDVRDQTPDLDDPDWVDVRVQHVKAGSLRAMLRLAGIDDEGTEVRPGLAFDSSVAGVAGVTVKAGVALHPCMMQRYIAWWSRLRIPAQDRAWHLVNSMVLRDDHYPTVMRQYISMQVPGVVLMGGWRR